jgi:hypothetical protein
MEEKNRSNYSTNYLVGTWKLKQSLDCSSIGEYEDPHCPTLNIRPKCILMQNITIFKLRFCLVKNS